MSVAAADLLARLDALPRASLGLLPTPVEAWPALLDGAGPQLFIKRDDQSGTAYGGNKVRKLEYLLAAAQARGAQTVMTAGYAGSNHALATAVYARALGLKAISLLLPQLNAPYVRRNLCAGHAVGAELVLCRNTPALVLAGLKRMRRGRTALIPPGGSSPLGNVGYVRAAVELWQQVIAGECPEPDRIYVPSGTMGTAAGLAVGLAATGLRTRVVGVRVTETRYASAAALRSLIRRTERFLRRRAGWPRATAVERVEMRDGYFGDQYAQVTPAAAAAVERAKAAGIVLETTYSGKTLAALIDEAGTVGPEETWLFWHTYNGQPLPAAEQSDYRQLPEALWLYFEQPDGVVP